MKTLNVFENTVIKRTKSRKIRKRHLIGFYVLIVRTASLLFKTIYEIEFFKKFLSKVCIYYDF